MGSFKSISILSLIMICSACSKEVSTKTDFDRGITDSNPSGIKNIDVKKPGPVVTANAKPMETDLSISVVVPSMLSKEIPLKSFVRTLESTNLSLKIKAVDLKNFGTDTTFTLMSQGYALDEKTVSLKSNDSELTLNFRAPRLSSEGLESGFENISYELLVTNNNHQSHLPFSFKIYSYSNSSLIIPSDDRCSIYFDPEPASGCLQNRSRTTQEVVFNDNITVGSERNVTFSGGITLSVGIVAAQFGAQKTNTSSQSTSQGSEIHFTNCIECSSMIYRQKVETIRKGDIYRVAADGSLNWVGNVKYATGALSYEFTSTGSESNNYSCDLKSQMVAGRIGNCDEISNP